MLRIWKSEYGVAKAKLALGAASLGVVAAAAIGGVLLLPSGSDEEEPVVQASPTASPAPTPAGPPLEESHRLVIEKIGVDAPVRTYGLDETAAPQVPTEADAAQVVAWYNFSARPGTGGNAVYAGHVTWNGNAVFLNLEQLQPGDMVRAVDSRGSEVVYRVTKNFKVDPTDPTSVDVMKSTGKDMITLITCGGSFFDTSDPVFGGDYSERIIVQGEMVSVSRANV